MSIRALARLFPWVALLCLGLYVLVLQSQLTAERDFLSSVQAQLHAPNSKHETLSAYLTGALDARDLAQAFIKQTSNDATAAQQRSDAADAQLEKTQEANRKKFSALTGQITALQNRKTAGSLINDCVVIEEDSKLPWKGWFQ